MVRILHRLPYFCVLLFEFFCLIGIGLFLFIPFDLFDILKCYLKYNGVSITSRKDTIKQNYFSMRSELQKMPHCKISPTGHENGFSFSGDMLDVRNE